MSAPTVYLVSDSGLCLTEKVDGLLEVVFQCVAVRDYT